MRFQIVNLYVNLNMVLYLRKIEVSIVWRGRKGRSNLKVGDRMFKSSIQILYLRAMFLIVDDPPDSAFVTINRQIGFYCI